MKLGIVGLPNVGKSTLFNAITNQKADAANYPFCTIDPNVGLVEVPDHRLDDLAILSNSKKIIRATIEFYDIAGLVKGASKGEGLGNKFLSNIRECDAIVHVVRCFEDENITHVDGTIDPKRDIETINLELIFSDIEILEKILEKTKKQAKGDKSLKVKIDLIEKILSTLYEGKSARTLTYSSEEIEILKSLQVLSIKPVIYVANISPDDIGKDNEFVKAVEDFASTEDAKVVTISAQIEQEISSLDSEEEKSEFLTMMGLEESGLHKLIKASYDLLGLMSFITTGEMETKAWTIKKNTKAVDAAAKIHTDIARGFIRAEIVSYDDLMEYKTLVQAREKGLVRLEGKDYLMQDGDCVHFRFNV